MQKITNFLQRFKEIALPNERERVAVKGVVQSELGIDLSIKDITIRNSVAYINGTGVTRSEIFLNKRKILSELEKVILPEKVIDIR